MRVLSIAEAAELLQGHCEGRCWRVTLCSSTSASAERVLCRVMSTNGSANISAKPWCPCLQQGQQGL